MNKKTMLLTALGLTLLTSFAYANITDSATFTRNFQLDVVNIDIRQSEDILDKIVPYEKVDYKVYVDNMEQSSWIRVKIPDNDLFELDDIQEGWIEHNGYYYYTQPFNTQSVLLCSSIQFLDIDESLQGTTHEFTIKAEAIQSAHFTLDFEKEDPFDGQEIVKANTRGGMTNE